MSNYIFEIQEETKNKDRVSIYLQVTIFLYYPTKEEEEE